WLAPEQVRILPISEKSNDYAQEVHECLKGAHLRCGLDTSDEKVGAKIARAHAEKVGYMLVVGPKEAQSRTVAVRMRAGPEAKSVKIDEFISKVRGKIADKCVNLAL
ncbi:MAG: His/Gly/Thr/Pro-type tRNA ligase C-terminal domain-containing protein, partial [Planctomycetota bacterium]